MWGIIQRPPDLGLSPLHDIAGRPLLARQLAWLRRIGCERIAVEVGPGPDGSALASWLVGADALCLDAIAVISPVRLGRAEIARRAGCPPDTTFVAIPGDVLGDCDPSRLFAEAAELDLVARPAPHPALSALPPGALVVGRGNLGAREGVCDGWTVRLRDARDAFEVARLALRLAREDEAPGVLSLAGSAVEPGVFLARGAVLEPGAIVNAPVWIGPGAIVRAGAEVGPDAVIGAGAIVDRGARLAQATCAARTVVGEGLDLVALDVSQEGLRPIDAPCEGRASLDDSLVLGARPSVRRLVDRLRVAVVCVLVAPVLWLVHRGDTSAVARTLADLVSGRRSLVGVGEPLPALRSSDGLRAMASRAPRGLVDLEPVLVPDHASVPLRLRARAWYAEAKCARLDARLVLRLARRRMLPRDRSSMHVRLTMRRRCD
jgi:carbonic anhydrase/acetyltransferase-like protein (isoleucine patch superfamily)